MIASIAENLLHASNHVFVSFKDIGYYHYPENESHATVISDQSYHMKDRKKIKFVLG